MAPNQMSTADFVRALRENGITNPGDRRALLNGKDLKEKIAGILENNPGLQEELDHTMGIGDIIIGHLHDVMEKDFQEPDALMRGLIEFFQTHGKVDATIYEITDETIRSFYSADKERVQDVNSLFTSSDEKTFINEKILLQTKSEESCNPIVDEGGSLCFQVVTPSTRLILSFGDTSTPKSELTKIQKLFKKTGLIQHIRQKLKHIQVKYTDHLTGLYNKHYVQSIMEKNTPYSVVFLDLDKFKEYNDIYGHSAGDILLQDMAKILESSVRYNDKVCRNGGDEFIIFIDGGEANTEIKILERIRERVGDFNLTKQKIVDNENSTYLPISITSGYAAWDPESSLEDIVRRADKEMFKSKIEKGSEGGLYRIINKISELPDAQQKEVIAGIFAINLESINTAKDFRCPVKNQICKRPFHIMKKNS